MSDIAIRAEGLSKQYRIGGKQEAYRTLRDTLTGAAIAPFRRAKSLLRGRLIGGAQSSETIWALRDVSFEIKQGEAVGIIGRNGAGKSTLLKILSRITEPTEGYADLHGRVGSLLEVGTGFHHELTGRENIFLNGAILGMKQSEIRRKLDQIIDFAELDKFIDTPVKHYSSGMYMRLAFAVAASLEPEILMVDEVLAVGDAAFQKKCLGKMGDVAKEGRTVLFVSHNMVALQRLCNRAIWLDKGGIVEEGESSKVTSRYLQTSYSALTEVIWDDPSTAPGNDKVRLHRARLRPLDGSPADSITVRTPFTIEFEFWNLVPNAHLNLSLHLLSDEGVTLFNTVPIDESVWHGRPFPVGLFRSSCHIPGDLLNDGTHRVQLLVVKDQSVVIFSYDDILVFEVHDVAESRTFWFGKWAGAVRPRLKWHTELVEMPKRADLAIQEA